MPGATRYIWQPIRGLIRGAAELGGGGGKMALTVRRIEKLKKAGRYGDGHGLYLQVMSATNRSWVLRFERNGRERWLGLGPLHTFDLREARERSPKARPQLPDGIDPIEKRKRVRE